MNEEDLKILEEKIDVIINQNKIIQGYLQGLLLVSGLKIEDIEKFRKNLIKEVGIDEQG